MMTSNVYELIGRLVVRVVWLRYGRQIRIAVAVGTGAALVGGYVLARRQPPEG